MNHHSGAEGRKNSLIIVQSDIESRNRIAEHLNREISGVTAIGSAADCYDLLTREKFRVAVIDEVLSDLCGYALARFVRRNAGIPVIMLVGEAGDKVRMAAYLAGAIACVERRYALTELPLLVPNVLDFNAAVNKGARSGRWRVLRQGMFLIVPGGAKLRLTPKEYQFMVTLAEAGAAAVDRQILLTGLGYRDDVRGNKSLESMVHRLRAKVADTGNDDLLLTAHGIGWVLAFPVSIE